MEYVYGFLGYDIAYQLILLLYSLILGIIIGISFDILRASRVFLTFKSSSRPIRAVSDTVLVIVSFIEDTAFGLYSAIVLVLFCFKANNGTSRGFILFGTLLGFVLYLLTIGRLTHFFVEKLSELLYRLIGLTVKFILMPAAVLIRRAAVAIYKLTIGRAVCAVLHHLRLKYTKKTSRELKAIIARLYIDNRKDNGDETDSPANAGEACYIRSIYNHDNHPRRNTNRVQSARGRADETA